MWVDYKLYVFYFVRLILNALITFFFPKSTFFKNLMDHFFHQAYNIYLKIKSRLLLLGCIPHPPGGRMYFMNYQLVRYIPLPYFSLTNLIKFLLLERRKFWISNVYLSNILNLQPRTMGNKRKYKEMESDGPNESPKRGEKHQKMRESKDSGRTVANIPRRMQKSSKPL